ncbi:hypothetical protein D9M68_928780 [compost metagenome]
MPAKFSSCFTYTESISPKAASKVAPLAMASSRPGKFTHGTSTSKAQAMARNTAICSTDRQVPASSLKASNQPRASGAVSKRRITPISRSYTMASDDCMPLNRATMPNRPGTM